MEKSHKKKLLYIMGIDWTWIFQRPQILARHLEEHYDVTVVFPRSVAYYYKRKDNLPSNYRILWTFPWQEKNKIIGQISYFFAKRIFADINHFDLLMIGYPLFYRYIPISYHGKIIYDCMDNHEALYPYRKGVASVLQQEKRLVQNCDLLITTGIGLVRKMKLLTNEDKIVLIRNGTLCHKTYTPTATTVQAPYKIGYFGTVAAWFDFELLIKSVDELKDIEYHIIGPIQGAATSNHPQIIMEGIVNHNQLDDYTKDYVCFVMPFLVDDIVKYVDPVKLYEYIALGKCIISVKYPEVERFKDYVYLYSTPTEYLQLLRKLKKDGFPTKYSPDEQRKFLENNSWENRFCQLDQVLSKL